MNRLALAVAASTSLCLAAPLAHAQDADKGKSQFGQCRACHSLDAGKNGVGPSLHGMFGRTAGTVEKYSYSSDMKAAGEKGLKWDDATTFEYLADPGAFLKKYPNDRYTADEEQPSDRWVLRAAGRWEVLVQRGH